MRNGAHRFPGDPMLTVVRQQAAEREQEAHAERLLRAPVRQTRAPAGPTRIRAALGGLLVSLGSAIEGRARDDACMDRRPV
jgi:hypothetical protein